MAKRELNMVAVRVVQAQERVAEIALLIGALRTDAYRLPPNRRRPMLDAISSMEESTTEAANDLLTISECARAAAGLL